MSRGKRRRARLARPQPPPEPERPSLATPPLPAGAVRVDPTALAPCNSYGAPAFLERGYYRDEPFTCADCGAAQVFTADQQQWWYEVAKGQIYSRAIRCRDCRRKRKPPRG